MCQYLGNHEQEWTGAATQFLFIPVGVTVRWKVTHGGLEVRLRDKGSV